MPVRGWLLLVFGLLGVLGAAVVAVARKPLRAALGLFLAYLAISGALFALGAPFLGAVQIIVYAGGIAVFILMAIYLLGLGGLGEHVEKSIFTLLAGVFSLSLALAFGALVWVAREGFPPAAPPYGSARALAELLMGPWVLAFEAASLVLTVGIVAAIALTRRQR